MSYSVEDLNPALPVLIIDGKEITISFVTLHLEVIFKDQYGSLPKLFEELEKNKQLIIPIIWELVINKPQFNNSVEDFKKCIFSTKESLIDVSKKMTACLNDSVHKSMPLIKNKQRYEDIQKLKKATTDEATEKPCYATYFDTVAKRYGYTLDQFYELTLRKLHIILNTIGDESYKELEVQAALNGVKLKPRMTYRDVSPEEEKEQEEDAFAALKKLKENYEKGKKDK